MFSVGTVRKQVVAKLAVSQIAEVIYKILSRQFFYLSTLT
jgi:hypothetical protein